ncbi:MAG: PAS domain S-box protein, partial [Syntrophorhabdaceae bacterium]|nr:PAS domain S-box protein [Syntrophorhabdaceae bacterium]
TAAKGSAKRKPAEESSIKTKTLLDKIFASIKSGVFVVDAATRKIITVNISTRHIFGYTRDEIIGLDVALLHVDTEQFRKFSEELLPALKINGMYNAEFPLRRKDGSVFISDLTVTDLQDDSGHRTGFVCAVRDITALKQVHEELITSETRYRRLFETARDGILILNADTGQIEDINPFLADMLGYTREECLDKKLWDIGAFQDIKTSKSVFEELQRTGYVRYEDMSLVTKDGRDIAVEFVGHIYTVDHAKVIQCTIRNITESKEVKKYLKLMNERFALATHASGIGIWDWNVFSNTLVWDDRMFELYGIARDSFPDCVEAWQNSLHPDDRTEALEASQKALRGENEYDTEFRILTPDGAVKYIKAYGKVLRDSKDRPLRMIGINYDITTFRQAEKMLRESEERHRSYIDVTGQLGWVTNVDGEVEGDMPSWRKYTGQNYEEIVGLGWSKALHPDDLEHALQAWARALATKKDYETEYRVRRHDGVYRHFMARGVPVIREDGSVREWVGTCIEITERKQMEEELRKSHVELERRVEERTAQLSESNRQLQKEITRCKIIENELNQSQKRLRYLSDHLQRVGEKERALLARELHDELGQVLTGMKMDVSWIAKRLPEDNMLVMERIRSLLAVIDKVIKNIQRMSMELRPVALDDFGLNEAIRIMIKDFEKNTDIAFTFIPEPQDMILGREIATEVFRIFQEGVTNVVRHADARNVTVFLRKKRDRLVMEIRDDGKGIAKSEILHPRSIGITGMRERAYAIRGVLAIKGVRDKGTTISLSVPLYTETRKGGPAHIRARS